MSDALPDTLTPEQAQSLGFISKAAPAHGGDMLPDTLTPQQAARLGLIDHPAVDKGPEARGRRTSPSMFKSDEELGLDRGPQFYRGTGETGPTNDRPVGAFNSGLVTNARDATGTQAYASRHAGDEMNDPIAQAITGAALAAPGAAMVGAAAPAALAPMLSGAASGGQQAAMMGADPVTGAVLGAIPGVPAAARAADTAIGEAALARATNPARTPGAGPVATAVGKYAGKAVGGAVGGHTAGLTGAAIGQHYGGKLGVQMAQSVANAGAKATDALANRYLRQQAAQAVVAPRMVNLAPLVHEGPSLPTELPNGAMGTPFYDDFGNVVTDAKAANQMVNHATVGGNTAVSLPDKSFAESVVGRLKNGTSLSDAVKAAEEEPSLREAVIRDAKKFRSQASPDVEAAPEEDLAATMQRSIDILEKLKAAKSAGNLTDEMVQGAVDAGVTPALIRKVTGKAVN